MVNPIYPLFLNFLLSTGDIRDMAESLPDEILVAVFSFLPDFTSLRNAALVSPVWLRCAASACRRVLLNEIGHPTLPDAITAHESSKFNPKNLARVAAFSDQYLQRRPPIPSTITLADGAALSDLHSCVKHLASKFQRLALHRLAKEQRGLANEIPGWPEPLKSPVNPTAAEDARFQRALYRFEVYCKLFKEPEVVRFNLDAVNFQKIYYFDHLSPWEIEQLVAVRDFLAASIIGPRKCPTPSPLQTTPV